MRHPGVPAAPPAGRHVGDDPRRAGAVVLDRAAWAVLLEQLPDPLAAGVPADFAVRVDLLADPHTLAAARPEAADRLRAGGFLDRDGAPSPAALLLFRVLATAAVRVRVRAWARDRTVTCALVVTAAGGVGLTRLERVVRDRDGTPRPAGAGAGVEVCLFAGTCVADGVWRAVPPPVRGAVRPATDRVSAADGVLVPWPQGLAAAAAAAESAGMDAAVRAALAAAAGWDLVPPVVAQLAAGLDAAVEVTVSAHHRPAGRAPDAAGGEATPASVLWHGTWLGTEAGGSGLRLVAVRAEQPAGKDVALRLVDTDGAGLRTDLVTALAGAFESAGLAADGGPELGAGEDGRAR